jgi:hypothetical protein
MSAHIVLEGFSEFREELMRLPDELADQGATIVLAHAEAAEKSIRDAYPRSRKVSKRGKPHRHLADSLVLDKEQSRYGIFVRLRNMAYHAHIYEWGSAVRESRGAVRGSAPATHVFVPRAQLWRRAMYAALRHMLEGAGFIVKGDIP